jgi:hypothetical protein
MPAKGTKKATGNKDPGKFVKKNLAVDPKRSGKVKGGMTEIQDVYYDVCLDTVKAAPRKRTRP